MWSCATGRCQRREQGSVDSSEGSVPQEYAFMAALGLRGLPVPRAVDHNRHAVLMSLVDAYPLTQVRIRALPYTIVGNERPTSCNRR